MRRPVPRPPGRPPALTPLAGGRSRPAPAPRLRKGQHRAGLGNARTGRTSPPSAQDDDLLLRLGRRHLLCRIGLATTRQGGGAERTPRERLASV